MTRSNIAHQSLLISLSGEIRGVLVELTKSSYVTILKADTPSVDAL
jgi:hypothetical protein